VPFLLIDVRHYAPSAAGAAFLPFIALQFTLARWSGGLIARYGARAPLVGGALVAGLGFLAFMVPGEGGSYWSTYFPAVVLLGIGGVFFVAPLTTTVFDAVSTDEAGIASGVNNAVARTAGLLAIAAFGILLSAVFAARFDAELGRARLSHQTIQVVHLQRGQLFAGAVPAGLAPADRPVVTELVHDSYLAGFPGRHGGFGPPVRAGCRDCGGHHSGSIFGQSLSGFTGAERRGRARVDAPSPHDMLRGFRPTRRGSAAFVCVPEYRVPTISQLVRKGREKQQKKVKTPAFRVVSTGPKPGHPDLPNRTFEVAR